MRKLFIVASIFISLILNPLHIVLAKEVSMKEKIGQMLVIGFNGTELQPHDPIVKAIQAHQVGGVILFDYDFQTKTFDHNIKNPEQVKQLTQQLQTYQQEAARDGSNNLPLIIGIDYEGGKVNRLKENYGFPATLSAADIAQLPLAAAQQYALTMAQTLQQAGINMNFAPVLDVNVNPENPVIGKLGRSFSNDPKKVATYANLFSKAYQDHGILCAYKHFPGHGSSTTDSHAGFVDVTDTWKESELEPYKELINQPTACSMVMTAHVVNRNLDKNNYPATLSVAITQHWLREKLHFNGVVVTDDLQMKAITDNYGLAEALRLTINAGSDILIFGNQLVPTPQDPEQIINMIYADVKAGKIPESRINEAYQRIIKLKESIRTPVTL